MEEIACAVPDSPDGVMPVLLEELAPLQLSAVFWRADIYKQVCAEWWQLLPLARDAPKLRLPNPFLAGLKDAEDDCALPVFNNWVSAVLRIWWAIKEMEMMSFITF